MVKVRKLSDRDVDILNAFLSRVKGGDIPNAAALDGFFAALICCPDLIMPGEYMEVIQCGETEDDDLIFENLKEAQTFTGLINRQWNHVNYQLSSEKIFLPLVLLGEDGHENTSDWAKGFLLGVSLRPEIWSEIFDDEERGGPMVPILALAYENDPDPEMRAFNEPISAEQREKLIVGAAAGVMLFYEYFYDQRQFYQPMIKQPVVKAHKVGRNEPCPCGSGKKFKKCCGHFSSEETLH